MDHPASDAERRDTSNGLTRSAVDAAADGGIDKPRVRAPVVELLAALGEDVTREGLVDTPRRVADMYAEILSGLHEDPAHYLDVTFDEQHEEMIVVRDIPFYSLCEHPLLPFHGRAHVAYIPRGRVVGISKIARLVDSAAKRL